MVMSHQYILFDEIPELAAWSKEAGHKLLEAGIANVYHIDEGFEGELDDQHHRSSTGGWRYHNLPWEQC